MSGERYVIDPADMIRIATDFTACTVLPVLADGTPLCELPQCEGRPHAYVKLWRHHAAQPYADQINAAQYARLHDYFGRGTAQGRDVLRELRALRWEAKREARN
jgi:ribulose kinase